MPSGYHIRVWWLCGGCFSPERVSRSSRGWCRRHRTKHPIGVRLDMWVSLGPLLFPPCRVISKGQTSSLTLGMGLQCPMLTSAPSRMASSTCTRVRASSRWRPMQRTTWAQTQLSSSCTWFPMHFLIFLLNVHCRGKCAWQNLKTRVQIPVLSPRADINLMKQMTLKSWKHANERFLVQQILNTYWFCPLSTSFPPLPVFHLPLSHLLILNCS